MRILLWHGYLLEGTGSNIYTRAVAREWGRAGHEVVVFCQDPAPERFDLAGAEVVRPELDTRLPDLRDRPVRGARTRPAPGHAP